MIIPNICLRSRFFHILFSTFIKKVRINFRQQICPHTCSKLHEKCTKIFCSFSVLIQPKLLSKLLFNFVSGTGEKFLITLPIVQPDVSMIWEAQTANGKSLFTKVERRKVNNFCINSITSWNSEIENQTRFI